MIKSPLRYPGGKSRAIKFLLPLIPEGYEFREPFVGGGSVWLSVAQSRNFERIWINDLNHSLMCFWESAITDNESLANLVKIQYEKEKTKDLYFEMLELETESTVEEGMRFFVLNRITFSGVTESGGYSNEAHKRRFTASSIERLEKLGYFKGYNIKTTNTDFEEVITAPGKDVVIFLDPPYYKAEKSKLYGKKGDLHTGFDHERLYEVLRNSEHKWLMTYDNSEYIRDLYKEFYQYQWSLQYGMTNKVSEENNELLVSNYRLDL